MRPRYPFAEPWIGPPRKQKRGFLAFLSDIHCHLFFDRDKFLAAVFSVALNVTTLSVTWLNQYCLTFNIRQSHETDSLYNTEASSFFFLSKTKLSDDTFPVVLGWRRPQQYSLYPSPLRVVVPIVYLHFKGVVRIIIFWLAELV